MNVDETIPVRRMEIELNEKTSQALKQRMKKEALNPSTLFNRAMQIYDLIMVAQENGTQITIDGKPFFITS